LTFQNCGVSGALSNSINVWLSIQTMVAINRNSGKDSVVARLAIIVQLIRVQPGSGRIHHYCGRWTPVRSNVYSKLRRVRLALR
jgi:hypothetical protein